MNAPTRPAKLAFAFTLALVSSAQPAVAAVIAFDAIRHGERVDIHARATREFQALADEIERQFAARPQ